MSMDSHPGRGASQRAGPAANIPPQPPVLVVDDDLVMRTLLKRVLVDAGLAVEVYATAEDFLERADLAAPAVLLLDVRMPGLSGLELHRLLLQRGHTMPVVFLTGSSDIPSAVAAMRDGAFDFIEKPFDAVKLVERIRAALAACLRETGSRPGLGTHYQRALSTLTAREREVHDLMLTGKSSKAIAGLLGGSFRTVEIHRGRVLSKMGAAHLADLVRMAYQVDPDPASPP